MWSFLVALSCQPTEVTAPAQPVPAEVEAQPKSPPTIQARITQLSSLSQADDPLVMLAKTGLKGDGGLAVLTELCDDIGHRLSGSPQLQQAVLWGEQKMRDIGLVNVRQQETLVPHWQRGAESLRWLQPVDRPRPLLGLGMSVGTDGRPVRAEAVVVRDFEELTQLGQQVAGKIVVYNSPFTTYGENVRYRIRGASEAAKLGAKAVLVRSVTSQSLSTPHTGTLRYDPEQPKIPAAAITLEDAEQLQRWSDRGKTIEVELSMAARQFDDAPSANVIGDIAGGSRPDEIVLLGAHLDSWDVGQGAQDDGAGVAMVLEAMRLLASMPPAKRSIRAVLFTNEENGLAGGRAYAENVSPLENHIAAIEADSGAGVPLNFSFKQPESMRDPQLKQVLQQLETVQPVLNVLSMTTPTAGFAGADINPLIAIGTLGFGLKLDTSTYWPIHHTEADTIDKVDPQNLQLGATALAVMAYGLATMEQLPSSETADE